MRALITGGGGFVGFHLAELLSSRGVEVRATVEHAEDSSHLSMPGVSIVTSDIRRADSIGRIIEDFLPDHIYHLAAISAVPRSLREPLLTYETNVTGTLNVLEAARKMSRPPRVLCFSTGQVYDSSAPAGPLDEETPTKPETPYSASKLCGEIVAGQYHASWGLPVVIVRPFNCIGPRQSPAFVCSDFARQIVEISMEMRPPVVHTGDLSRKRDFTDVRDAARAFVLALESGKPGEAYNVCSGTLHSIQEVLDALAELAGLKITVETEAARERTIDPSAVVGDLSKLKRQTGWRPQIPFRQTLADLLSYWRDRVAATLPQNAR